MNTPTKETTDLLELDSAAIDVGIIGGAGYTAGELIRLLSTHPKIEKLFVQSQSHWATFLRLIPI